MYMSPEVDKKSGVNIERALYNYFALENETITFINVRSNHYYSLASAIIISAYCQLVYLLFNFSALTINA